MYLRTSRLDLDDYNNDTEDGLHITSMGGTWMAVVMGLGGMRFRDGKLIFNPILPEVGLATRLWYVFVVHYWKVRCQQEKHRNCEPFSSFLFQTVINGGEFWLKDTLPKFNK
jgi:trehalose/maltose hydrolase-like predicted phosphorylase